ncbi:family 78 glycoside hydrolase catalytic domain [Streptosporangium sp. NPDC001681]|uniref:family 78 glycoside hydrolase catalytic domain n=1 Tax=Streptosporangium sp. NPDC001681 TaxID=3154395 RepID=UPI00332305A0
MKLVLTAALILTNVIVPNHTDLRVTDLETEHAPAPIAIAATNPRLGWLLRAERKGQKQTAYEVEISEGGRRVWNSGAVKSESHYDIRYAGPPLRPATRYTWRVKAADMNGTWSAWSGKSWFETAPATVHGAWIGAPGTPDAPPDLTGTKWIWYPEGDPLRSAPAGTRYFRKSIDLTEVPSTARLILTVDDGFTAWVNGVEVGARDADPRLESWRRPIVVDVADKLRQGRNAIAVKAINGGQSPAGVLGRLEGVVDTDASWRTTDTEPSAGWTSAAFDDSSWAAARELTTWGGDPWGRVVPEPARGTGTPDLTGTDWIWYPEGDPAAHAPAATRYFRRTFDVAAIPEVARLVMTADDGFTAWINGVEVGATNPDPTQDSWRRPIVVDVADKLRQGPNVIAVKAINGRPGPAGLLGRLEGLVDTDASWRTTDTEPSAGWTSATFDDSLWRVAKHLATWGDGPWGKVVPERETLPEPLLRRAFRVGKAIAQARLHAAAGGYVELSLNGRRVGDQVLQPGFTRYDTRLQYVTYDVTKLLREGGNVIGARLGRGFYGMTQRNVWDWDSTAWNGEPRLKADLVVTYTDGSTESIATDGQWRYAQGPVRFDSLYGGETYDAREEQRGWDTTSFDASTWAAAKVVPAPKGELVPQEQEPIRVTDTLRPESVTEPKPGTYVFKLPRNIAGWARIRTHGPKGTTIRLKYGERLNADGTVLAASGHVTGRFQIDEYVLAGKDRTETWEPRYTYHGFQYVEVTGWPGDAPTAGDLDGREVHSDLRSVGTFRSSNPLFNQINAMTRQTVLNNWHGIPTDTPMYEKNGWTGDAQLMAAMETSEFDLRRQFTKWMTDHRDSLGPDGLVPAIVPDNGWGLGPGWPSPPWQASFTVIPWLMYQRYGDRDLLAENYPEMRRYLDGWLKRSTTGLYPSTLNDYLAPGYGGNSPEDMRLAGTAYTYSNTLIVADAAEVLGERADAARYREAAAKMKDAFNREFLRGDAYVTNSDPDYRQTSALIGLALGLAPAGQEKAITDRLVRDIEARGDHLNTGALGTKYLLTELTKRGHGELAYRVANQRTYPSWGYWADNGATTLWERWDLDARSRDHVFLGGAIGEWFFQDLAGLHVTRDRIRVAPRFLGDLKYVEASTQTVDGRVSVRWKRDSGRFTLHVTVPVGALATVELPSGIRHEIGSGSHTFNGETS